MPIFDDSYGKTEKPKPEVQPRDNGAIEWPDTDSITELAKHATPTLFKKAVELALKSNDPRLVRDVAVIASDRAHGKPHQSATVQGDMQLTIVCNIPYAPNTRKAIEDSKTIDMPPAIQ